MRFSRNEDCNIVRRIDIPHWNSDPNQELETKEVVVIDWMSNEVVEIIEFSLIYDTNEIKSIMAIQLKCGFDAYNNMELHLLSTKKSDDDLNYHKLVSNDESLKVVNIRRGMFDDVFDSLGCVYFK